MHPMTLCTFIRHGQNLNQLSNCWSRPGSDHPSHDSLFHAKCIPSKCGLNIWIIIWVDWLLHLPMYLPLFLNSLTNVQNTFLILTFLLFYATRQQCLFGLMPVMRQPKHIPCMLFLPPFACIVLAAHCVYYIQYACSHHQGLLFGGTFLDHHCTVPDSTMHCKSSVPLIILIF